MPGPPEAVIVPLGTAALSEGRAAAQATAMTTATATASRAMASANALAATAPRRFLIDGADMVPVPGARVRSLTAVEVITVSRQGIGTGIGACVNGATKIAIHRSI